MATSETVAPAKPAKKSAPATAAKAAGSVKAAKTPKASGMPAMLAYTIQGSPWSSNAPYAVIGYGSNGTGLRPANPQDDSYWIAILDASNPRVKVKDWVVPGTSNSSVPGGLDTYMNDPKYLFIVATQYLSTLHVPQGDFYRFLVNYGAGRELQKLEQINTVLSCGSYGRMSYVLTGQCGTRVPGQPSPPSFEVGSYTEQGALLLMSLMPGKNGAPPYSICDSYTFHV